MQRDMPDSEIKRFTAIVLVIIGVIFLVMGAFWLALCFIVIGMIIGAL